ncbi:MAG: ABC transporter ATP-binding protein [Desulfobacter sp.]|nr:ABC transporter ATP-binding protein [Desulfobacter sp.]WDP87397.1 MAG: ABC transporter ATP-binding protein [Desulfobacter sp.]
MKPKSPLLLIDQLRVKIPTPRGVVHAVDRVSLSVEKGKILGLVGESGCGKSILCKSILGLLPKGAVISEKSKIMFKGNVLNTLPENELNKIRGRQVAMVFQDPMTALNPVMKIGRQIAEPLVHHLGMGRKKALKKSVELMALAGIPKPGMRLDQYPHQLSGGLCQRVVIAMALACNPQLLIADEPTTALDVTVQAEILDLLDRLGKEQNMAVILVTHDLSVATARCQDIAVMYGGKLVETAPAKTFFSRMKMPYTRALFESLPRLENPVHSKLNPIDGRPPNLISPPRGCCFAPRCACAAQLCHEKKPPFLCGDDKAYKTACWYPLTSPGKGSEQDPIKNKRHWVLNKMDKKKDNTPVLDVQNLMVDYPLSRKKVLPAVIDVSFNIFKGETLGLVGESGCGKTSVARAIIQLPKPTSGRVLFWGEDLTQVSNRRLRQLRPNFQIVFQDAVAALNPRRKIGEAITHPLHMIPQEKASQKKQRVLEIMDQAGIDPDLFDRRPCELSGGQCQRVQIARALMTKPSLLILDEPVSSIDVSIQAQILNLLENLRKQYDLTLLFISHDLSVVKNACDRVAVMYLGKLCEIAPCETLYRTPIHPYTRALLNAIPSPDPFKPSSNAPLMSDEMPSKVSFVWGCRFKTRCPKAVDRCEKKAPLLKMIDADHWVACHFV